MSDASIKYEEDLGHVEMVLASMPDPSWGSVRLTVLGPFVCMM